MAAAVFMFLLAGTVSVVLGVDLRVSLYDSQTYPPSAYKNKLYYLSRTTYNNYDQASYWCAWNGGGYPAEVDSAPELAFLEQYLVVTAPSTAMVYISGTDARIDGRWLSQRTGSPLIIFDWAPGEPNNSGGREDCLEMWLRNQARFNDGPCANAPENRYVLCEKDLF
ncbi:pulmonary surfactant-associated protein D [Biomphalaria glabrata]|nr:pulmonary surfactant-associated protein D [Biomphalaria glabrata]